MAHKMTRKRTNGASKENIGPSPERADVSAADSAGVGERKDAEGQGWFSSDCPHCGSSNVVGTNKAERAGAILAAGAAGLFAASLFTPVVGGGAAISLNKAICDHADYICLDCKKKFSVNR